MTLSPNGSSLSNSSSPVFVTVVPIYSKDWPIAIFLWALLSDFMMAYSSSDSHALLTSSDRLLPDGALPPTSPGTPLWPWFPEPGSSSSFSGSPATAFPILSTSLPCISPPSSPKNRAVSMHFFRISRPSANGWNMEAASSSSSAMVRNFAPVISRSRQSGSPS